MSGPEEPDHDPSNDSIDQRPTVVEPQLKYESLEGDVPSILKDETVTCLCLSDKILAIGTDAGRTHVLDYSGNQVRLFEHHKSPVSDLAFDAAGEYLASCSGDGSVTTCSLYSDTVIKYDYSQPVQAVALDPRYASRKTREVAVLFGNMGSVVLSSQGWLGRSDTPLYKGPGTQLVRWWGQLIAWITGDKLMVYSTVQHLMIRTLSRAAKGPAAAYNHASLLWGQNGYLYASWPDCILVCRTYSVENNVGLSTMQLEVVAQWQPNYLVLGVSPFGRDLAVLTFQAAVQPEPTAPQPGRSPSKSDTPSQPSTANDTTGEPAKKEQAQPASNDQGSDDTANQAASASGQTTTSGNVDAAAEQGADQAGNSQPACLQLHITTLQGSQLACDKLDVGDLLELLPGGRSPYTLVPSLPATTASATSTKRIRDHAAAVLKHSPSTLSSAYAGAAVVGGLFSTRPSKSQPSSVPAGQTQTSQGGAETAAGSPVALSRSSSGTTSGPVSGRVSETGAKRATASSTVGLGPPTHNPDYDEDAEFTYFVLTGKAVLVGRMRDITDHATWLMSQGRWDEALVVCEQRPREVKQDVQEQVVQGYIGYLLSKAAWDEAAALSPRLLKGNASMWERWVYMFAQAKQLPLLAEIIPTTNPRLPAQVYDLVLHSLLSNTQDQATALKLARAWPAGCYSAPALVDAVVSRMKRGGPGSDTKELWLLLSHLYEGQGRPDLALSILLQLKDTTAFAYLAGRHEGLLARLTSKRIAQLLDLDAPRATRLLVRHMDIVPPNRVVPALQEAMFDATDDTAKEKWRHMLWSYLAAVHDADPAAVAPYAEIQVSLTADYAPSKLLELLGSASNVPLEAALAICEDKGLVGEQVFILGRMGNALRALHLIIDRLGDIPQAIQFVEGQGDEELWEQLISWALSSPETTGALLDHIGGHLNPLALIRRIPAGLTIPRLRDRIRSIIADFRTQTSLREGCNVILRTDCARLVMRLHAAATAAISTVFVPPAAGRADTGAAATTAWSKLDSTHNISQPQPIASHIDIPAVVLQAAAALTGTGLAREPSGPLGSRHGTAAFPTGKGLQDQEGEMQGVWVGCIPTVSSEDTAGSGNLRHSESRRSSISPPRQRGSAHPYSAQSRRRTASIGNTGGLGNSLRKGSETSSGSGQAEALPSLVLR